MRQRFSRLVVAVLTVLTVLLPMGEAWAAPFARAEYHGYFLNAFDDWGDNVLNAGIHPTPAPLSPTGKPCVESFIAAIKTYLVSGSPQDKTGARFLVLTMTGKPAGTVWPVNPALTVLIADWEGRVRYYSDQNWVTWGPNCDGVPHAFSTNTFWQGNGPGSNPNDDAWYNDPGGSTPDAIIFHQPATTDFYAIREACANPLGDANGLNQPTFNVNLSASSNPPQVAGVAKVVAGDPVDINVGLVNSGPAPSQPGDLQVMYPGAAFATAPCPVACATTPAQQSVLTGGHSSGDGFRSASAIGGVVGKNWFWNVTGMGAGATNGRVTFTVPATAPVGSTFTVDVWFEPTNLAGAQDHVQLHFRVISRRVPGIEADSGDVHAGDCTQPAANGYVQTNASGASFGQYAVSATAGISNFASNNNAAADSLRLGVNGGYACLQRPDIYGIAAAGMSGPGYTTIPVQDFFLTGNEEGVYYYIGVSPLKLHGTVGNPLAPGVARRPVTIVTNGSVEITGNITLNPTILPAHSVSSLGIIANGGISIDPAVTRVDAYLFSNGTINTCNAVAAACSTPTLRINGFMMGKQLIFGRLGAANTNGTPVSEQVVLTPQIYLNPPKYFDSSIDDILLQGQGERAPLF
ncbi:MAG TPA: hypothetical protein VMT30_01640 [Candidatus Saccharimonadia bacterium]|nr:hypothetical protein [Candidatus Saccharimonadia bacterium]